MGCCHSRVPLPVDGVSYNNLGARPTTRSTQAVVGITTSRNLTATSSFPGLHTRRAHLTSSGNNAGATELILQESEPSTTQTEAQQREHQCRRRSDQNPGDATGEEVAADNNIDATTTTTISDTLPLQQHINCPLRLFPSTGSMKFHGSLAIVTGSNFRNGARDEFRRRSGGGTGNRRRPRGCDGVDECDTNGNPWTRTTLGRERDAFWDTRVTGRREIWDTLRALVEVLLEAAQRGAAMQRQRRRRQQQKMQKQHNGLEKVNPLLGVASSSSTSATVGAAGVDEDDEDLQAKAVVDEALKTAQGILDAAEITLPTGQLWDGAYDAWGNLYKVPRFVVVDPPGLLDNDDVDNGDDDGNDDSGGDGEVDSTANTAAVPASASAVTAGDSGDAPSPSLCVDRQELEIEKQPSPSKSPTAGVTKAEAQAEHSAIATSVSQDQEVKQAPTTVAGIANKQGSTPLSLHVRMSDSGKDYAVAMYTSDTVQLLEQKLRDALGLSATSRIRFILMGKLLSGAQKIGDINYCNGQKLNCFVGHAQ